MDVTRKLLVTSRLLGVRFGKSQKIIHKFFNWLRAGGPHSCVVQGSSVWKTAEFFYSIVFFMWVLKQGLTVLSRIIWNSLCNPGQPRTDASPLASASYGLGLYPRVLAGTTITGLFYCKWRNYLAYKLCLKLLKQKPLDGSCWSLPHCWDKTPDTA